MGEEESEVSEACLAALRAANEVIGEKCGESSSDRIEIKHPTEGSIFYDLPLGWKLIGVITITETGEKLVKIEHPTGVCRYYDLPEGYKLIGVTGREAVKGKR